MSSPTTPPDGSAKGRGSLLAIFLTVFIDLLGFGIVLPLLPLYAEHFARELNIDSHRTGLLVGLLMASFSAMQFLFLPIWGRASDRWGRRPIILLGLVGSTLFYFLFGLATVFSSLTGLFIARIGAGIAGATISTAQAYIADTTAPQQRARGMALIGAAFALGFTVGPLLCVAALLFGGDAETNPWPAYTASAMSAVALLIAWFRLPESLHAGSRTAREKLFDLRVIRSIRATPSVALLLFTRSQILSRLCRCRSSDC
jgi:DHA1 family tetracycline resistance protein-like MFS transporter